MESKVLEEGLPVSAEKEIRHEGDKWVVYSEDGTKKLGEYDTEEEAKKRLRQIEYFKHQNKAAIRVRVRPPEDFDPESFRTIVLDEEKGIKAVIGKLPGKDTTTTQAFLFEGEGWTQESAEKWVEEHSQKKKKTKEYTPEGNVQRLDESLLAAIHESLAEEADWLVRSGYLDPSEYLTLLESVTAVLNAARSELERLLPPEVLSRPLEKISVEPGIELSPDSWMFQSLEDGRIRWYSLTATDIRDKQGEVITPEAMDWSVMVSNLVGDRGPLLFRHLPLRLGICDKQARIGPLLFESGLLDPVDENPLVGPVLRLVSSEPERWRISPGLRFKASDLTPSGEYQRCWIVERSLTAAPANPTTAFYVWREKMKVTDEMLKEAAEQLGLPFEQVKALAQTYLDANKEFSSLSEVLKELASAVSSTAEVDSPSKGSELLKAVKENTEALQELIQAVKELVASRGTEAAVKALEDYVSQLPRAEFGSRRASTGDGDEAEVRALLKEAGSRLEALQQGRTLQSFEALFTSSTLNRTKR